MTKIPYNITGFSGVDTTSDPFILGQKDPQTASLAYNYRARKGGIRTVRGGLREVVTGGAFKRSGMYFPIDAGVVIPYQVMPADFGECGMMALDGVDFTVEFWYKCGFAAYDRTVGENPYVIDDIAAYTHLKVVFYPVVESGSTQIDTGLQFEFLSYEETGSDDIVTGRVFSYESIPTDGEWHHIAITRKPDGTMWVGIDADELAEMTALTGATTDPVIAPEHVANTTYQVNTYGLFGNCYKMGLDKGSLAEWRMWSDYRTISEILANKDVVVDPTAEANLLFYVPFDEATGKRPQEKAGVARGHTNAYGYLTPSEPYVNDSNELVFNGNDSIAIPSTVGGFTTPIGSSRDRNNEAFILNSDGAIHGSILWDRALYVTSDTGGDADYTLTSSAEDAYLGSGMGIYKGTAQIRVKLQQLCEGIIAGRLGIIWVATENKYGLYFIDTDPSSGISPHPDNHKQMWLANSTEGWVDTGWIDTEKTITVVYDGTRAIADRVKMFVDGDEVTLNNAATAQWNAPAGGSNEDMMSGTYQAFQDNWSMVLHHTDGAIGGTFRLPDMGLAFDLVLLRQWWDDHPYSGTAADDDADNQALVDATYNTTTLSDRDRIFKERANTDDTDPVGAISSMVTFWIADLDGIQFKDYRRRMFIVAPSLSFLEKEGGNLVGGAGGDELGNYSIVKRGVQWNRAQGIEAASEKRVLFQTEESLTLVKDYATFLWRSGFLLSNLICDLNADTFKYNQEVRAMFSDGAGSTTSDDMDYRYRDQKLVNTIVDDSPIQGSERIGAETYKTRYFELNGGGNASRSGHTIYNLRGLSPRWCDGPITYASSFPYVQTICRYKTEKGDIDKLFTVTNSQVWEVNTTTGACTPADFSWIKADLDEHVGFSMASNRGVFMSTDDAIKISARDEFSFLGVERPVHIKFTEIPEATDPDTFTVGVMNHQQRIGYTMQYYDKVNNVYSGTMPVFKESNTTIYIDSQVTDALDAPEVELVAYGNGNPDAERLLLYKTRDLEGVGSESLLFLASDQIIPNSNDDVIVYDRLRYDLTTTQPLLPAVQYGQDLVPDPGAAMEMAYGRLFIFNVDALASALTWSDVDPLGFAVPDQFPELNAMIIEEGGTTAGKALQKYNNILYAFKDNSIFRINPEAGGTFSSQLVYKGVGALNQRCVQVAGNSMFFMDTNGIYNYTEGEPRLVTVGLTDFFSDDVNQTALPDKAFMLHSKKDDLLLSFLPSSGSSYCDRCIVLDLRAGTVTLEFLPHVTCGYVDDETIYLGTPYGKILEYDPDVLIDVVDSVVTGTGSVFGCNPYRWDTSFLARGRLQHRSPSIHCRHNQQKGVVRHDNH